MGRIHGVYLMEILHNKEVFEVNIPAFEMVTPFKYN
jgi:ApaG protein